MIIKHNKKTLITRGLLNPDTKYVTCTDSLNLGDGDPANNFSLRIWIKRNNDNIGWPFGKSTAYPFFALRFTQDANDWKFHFYAGANNRRNRGTIIYGVSGTTGNFKNAYFGADKITNNVVNWKMYYNNQQFLYADFNGNENNLQSTDQLIYSNPVIFSDDSAGHSNNVTSIFNSFMLFTGAELTAAQNGFLYNNGKGNLPIGDKARGQGIGVSGVDTIGVNGITTLLTRFLPFDQIYENAGSEYIGEYVTGNDNYGLLNGYGPSDLKIVNVFNY